MKYSLSEQFDEEKFYAKLNGSDEEIDMKIWLNEEMEGTII